MISSRSASSATAENPAARRFECRFKYRRWRSSLTGSMSRRSFPRTLSDSSVRSPTIGVRSRTLLSRRSRLTRLTSPASGERSEKPLLRNVIERNLLPARASNDAAASSSSPLLERSRSTRRRSSASAVTSSIRLLERRNVSRRRNCSIPPRSSIPRLPPSNSVIRKRSVRRSVPSGLSAFCLMTASRRSSANSISSEFQAERLPNSTTATTTDADMIGTRTRSFTGPDSSDGHDAGGVMELGPARLHSLRELAVRDDLQAELSHEAVQPE